MNIIKKIQADRSNRLREANCELSLAILDLYFNKLRRK